MVSWTCALKTAMLLLQKHSEYLRYVEIDRLRKEEERRIYTYGSQSLAKCCSVLNSIYRIMGKIYFFAIFAVDVVPQILICETTHTHVSAKLKPVKMSRYTVSHTMV